MVRVQTALQGHPAAGLDVLPFGSKSYRIREMIPDENRTSFDRFRKQPAKLRQAVETAGTLTAWSHLRGARKAADPGQDHWPELAQWSAGAAVDVDPRRRRPLRRPDQPRLRRFPECRARLRRTGPLPRIVRDGIPRIRMTPESSPKKFVTMPRDRRTY